MEKIEWEELTEVVGTIEADMIKIFYAAYDIKLETFQEATTQDVIPVTFGRVRVYVEKKNAQKARDLLEEYEKETK